MSPMSIERTLAPGLLLAAPNLREPSFARTVVLLGQHDEDGAMGWVLNGRAIGGVRDVLKQADLVPPGVRLPTRGSYAGLVRSGGPVEVGTAWVNQHRTTSAFVPFGGAKESGLGRQYSALGLKSYMEPEVVSVAKR